MKSAFVSPTREEWLDRVGKELNGADFSQRLIRRTSDGLRLQPLYVPAELLPQGRPPEPDRAALLRRFPAAFEGGSDWQIMTEHRHPLVEHMNRAIRTDLERGAHGVWVRLTGELGTEPVDADASAGARVNGVGDLERVFAGVDLERCTIGLAAGPWFYSAAAAMLALYSRRGVRNERVRCQLGADPLGALAASGSFPRPLEQALEELAELAWRVHQDYEAVRTINIAGYVYEAAGATAVQELAAALSTALTYLRALERRELSPGAASRQIVVSLASGTDPFLEIAKLRAFRLLYDRLLEAAQVAPAERACLVHARSSSRLLSQRDPHMNVLRSSVGCFGAVLGGADQITVLPFDDAIGPADELAQRLARNTQIILQEEAHLGHVREAAAGSYYVEHLSEVLAREAWERFREIERRGGMLQVLRDGSWATEIESTWLERERESARRKTPIVGVSEYPNLNEKPLRRAAPDRLAAPTPSPPLARQVAAQPTSASAFPEFVSAAEAGESLSRLEVALCLGKSTERARALPARRLAEPFERLRDRSDRWLAESGRRPRVFGAILGPFEVSGARATYARSFFATGGVEVLESSGYDDYRLVARDFAASGARTAIICSSNERYAQAAGDLARALRSQGARRVWLAGHPGKAEAEYRSAGIDAFIFQGCDVIELLSEFYRAEESEA